MTSLIKPARGTYLSTHERHKSWNRTLQAHQIYAYLLFKTLFASSVYPYLSTICHKGLCAPNHLRDRIRRDLDVFLVCQAYVCCEMGEDLVWDSWQYTKERIRGGGIRNNSIVSG